MNDLGTIIGILGGVIAVVTVAMSIARRWVRTEDRAEGVQSLTARVVLLEEWRARREEREAHVAKTLDEIHNDLSEVKDKVNVLWLLGKRSNKDPRDS